MTTVILLKQTRYFEKPVYVNDKLDVDKKTATRWSRKGICKIEVEETESNVEENLSSAEEPNVPEEVEETESKNDADKRKRKR
jgi:hypothetical protein